MPNVTVVTHMDKYIVRRTSVTLASFKRYEERTITDTGIRRLLYYGRWA